MTTCGGQNPTAPGAPSSLPPPTPAPSPSASAAPVLGMACGAGPGSPTFTCSSASPAYLNDVEDSITELEHESPEIFDLKDRKGPNPKVLSFGLYYEGLIKNLGERGLCSFYNGDSIQVKMTNSFDESYKVLASNGYVRTGSNDYSATCRPASFPQGDTAPPPTVPGCALPGSLAIACNAEPSPVYLGVMRNVITLVTQQHPEYFDFTNIEIGSDLGYKVLNPTGYIQAVGDVLSQQGYCHDYRSDAMGLKASNTLSESYKILTGQLFIRRDIGAYQQTCYPAAF